VRKGEERKGDGKCGVGFDARVNANFSGLATLDVEGFLAAFSGFVLVGLLMINYYMCA
jgi:hypothetical protein